MSVIKINVQATLQWFAKRADCSSRWIAECDPLGIAIEADSLDELHSLMPEATNLLFLDLMTDNEFDEFLRERGWSANGPETQLPDEMNFQVPMELVVASRANGLQQRAH